MRLLLLSLISMCMCIGCSRGMPAGLHSTDGGWNSREKSVPGVKTYYGATDKDDDNN